MACTNEPAVSLTARWNDWHWANAPLNALRDIHWHRPQGAPQPILHAYISCADIVAGKLSDTCHNCSAPHRMLVCVLRRHNLPAPYAELARMAGQARSSL